MDNSKQAVLSEAELRIVLSEVTMEHSALQFRWSFEIDKCQTPVGWFVRVSFHRPDAHTGVPGIGRGRWEFVERGTTVSGVVKTAWLLLELIVRHELMEAFHWKGHRIFNPHNTVGELASINGGVK